MFLSRARYPKRSAGERGKGRRRKGRVNAMRFERLEEEGRIHTEFDHYSERLCADHTGGPYGPTNASQM